MSAADRMAVRTRSGEYRSLPRRQALALIAAGRAEADKGSRLAEPIRQPDPVVWTGTPEAIATKMDELAPITLAPVDMSNVEITTPPDEVDAKLDQFRTQLADALDVPVEAITPTPGSNPYEVAAAQGQEMLDHLAAETARVQLPPEPKPTARRGEWADYADSLGVEVTSTMTKREIQTAAEEAAQSLSNLPQPALTGGRLETPEDEPATETVAHDQDPRTQ